MEYELARNWWAVALRGALAILFGVLVFFWPAVFWVVVVATFAAYALLDGAIALFAAVTGRGQGRRWLLAVEGILGLAAGVLTLLWPGLTELALFYLIAGWAMATGAFEVAAAIQLRHAIRGAWALGLAGVLSILL